MRFFLDTEFIERPGLLQLVSIGIVSWEGRSLYCVSTDFDRSKANDFVQTNVLPRLYAFGGTKVPDVCLTASNAEIAREVIHFCGQPATGKHEFWGYFADYDWVLFCWLFGPMVDLPKGFPYYCRDLKQWGDQLEQRLKRDVIAEVAQPEGEHNAMVDARWNERLYRYLAALDWGVAK